jgi:hypothetical protein
MSIQADRLSMFERCFKHYLKKLKELLHDEDLELGNDLLKDDIQTNIEKVQYLLNFWVKKKPDIKFE